MINPKPYPLNFEQFLIKEYFKHGSINKVFQEHKYNLPISFAGFDRILSKYKIVKSAGPNSKLSESLYILSLLSSYKIPLEKIYHHFAPKTIQVSTNTLHRILHYTRLRLTRRQGAALIITPKNQSHKVLMGKDLSLVNSSLGNKGDLSLPMGHSKTGESIRDTITRILQNEVFTNNTIQNNFPWNIIPKHIKPIMYINITDIKVAVYHLVFPKNLRGFSSFKLSNIKYNSIKSVQTEKHVRSGVKDILNNFSILNKGNQTNKIKVFDSELNNSLYALAKQPAE